MIKSSAVDSRATSYELRFTGLFNPGRGYAFPCDAVGHVDIDELTERARANYLFARTVVGSELSPPVVAPVRKREGIVLNEPCRSDETLR
jgi:hypothetical protein